MAEHVKYSLVLPCYNEVGNLIPLIEEIREVMEKIGKPFEIIYVDDCSNDGTTEKLRELKGVYPFLRHIRHKRNLGESAGTLTGFENARGDVVITMDADLQNDPRDIPAMLKKLRRVDCVCGVRRTRNDSIGKRLSSRGANFFRNAMLKDNIHDAGCTFRAIRRESLDQLIGFRALHRFLPSILQWHGYRVVEIKINHRPRTSGVSKYGFGNRFWVGIVDIIAMYWYKRRHFIPKRYLPEDEA
ncbi:MAG: glycosyltransferase family 2 protein [Candidatus Sumerlaeia bacterium]|nr:glycosyltransferase family 2 protein [Candidatus Sumerlaeia bacterium]